MAEGEGTLGARAEATRVAKSGNAVEGIVRARFGSRYGGCDLLQHRIVVVHVCICSSAVSGVQHMTCFGFE